MDAIIIGAGAAGLMSAGAALDSGKSVLILEANAKPGLKILTSGGGRCNFTNRSVTPHEFVSENPHFCKSALHQFSQDDFIQMVEEAGIPFYEKTLGQLFCQQGARAILDLLLKKIDSPDCTLVTGAKVSTVSHRDGFFSVCYNDKTATTKNLIVATGGLSFPKLGATDFGYRLAKQFGHKVTKLYPALDGFLFSDSDRQRLKGLEGISLEARLTCGRRSFTENILLTHVGLSGPAALKGSLFWSPGDQILIDFLPAMADWHAWLDQKKRTDAKKTLLTLLSSIMSKRLAAALLVPTKLGKKRMGDLSKADYAQMTGLLKKFHFIPKSTAGYHKAEVTRGGVKTDEISSQTMESKQWPGLFFVGEVLDVTGLLGGYNLQWAWSSGWVSGKNLRPHGV